MTDTPGPADLDDLADRLVAAREGGEPVGARPDLDLAGGYAVASRVEARLTDRGWTRAGRKMGFTDRATWAATGLDTPIWAPVYDRTLQDGAIEKGAATATAELSLAGTRAPRLEVEIVVGLWADLPDSPRTGEDVVSAVEWVAIGFELVDSPWSAGWDISPGEAVAGFGLHRELVLARRVDTSDGRPELAEELRGMALELRDADGTVVTGGTGHDALGGPLDALAHLTTLPGAAPVRAGEMIATGTLGTPPYVHPGQHWAVTVPRPVGPPTTVLGLTLTD